MGSLITNNTESPTHKRQRLENPQLVSVIMDVKIDDDFTLQLARQYIFDIYTYYDRYRICNLCHTIIDGIPFTYWTCDTCYLCEACVCEIYDRHMYDWDKQARHHCITHMKAGSVIPRIKESNIISDQIKCFICRSNETGCHTVHPRACNVKLFHQGKQLAQQLKKPIQSCTDLAEHDIQLFRSIFTQSVAVVTYTCPHCHVMKFTSTQHNQYMRHQLFCTFRPVACAFSDCSVKYKRNALIGWCSTPGDTVEDVMEFCGTTRFEPLDRHCQRKCQHKVVCNLMDCKNHTNNNRIVLMHDVSKHLKQFLLQHTPINHSQMDTPMFKKWDEKEMMRRFPESMNQCVNPKFDEDQLTLQAIQRATVNDDDDDDDPDYEPPSNVPIAQFTFVENSLRRR